MERLTRRGRRERVKGRNGPSHTPCKGSCYKRPCFLKERSNILHSVAEEEEHEDQCLVSFIFSWETHHQSLQRRIICMLFGPGTKTLIFNLAFLDKKIGEKQQPPIFWAALTWITRRLFLISLISSHVSHYRWQMTCAIWGPDQVAEGLDRWQMRASGEVCVATETDWWTELFPHRDVTMLGTLWLQQMCLPVLNKSKTIQLINDESRPWMTLTRPNESTDLGWRDTNSRLLCDGHSTDPLPHFVNTTRT